MADGVAEVEDGPQAALVLVLLHHARFQRAGMGQNVFQVGRRQVEQARRLALEEREEIFVAYYTIFDDFGEAGAALPQRQRAQRVRVNDDEARLMERADQVLGEFEPSPKLTPVLPPTLLST